MFQSEEGVGRTRLKDTFDQVEWQPFDTVDCYGWRLSEQYPSLERGQNYNLYGLWRLSRSSESGHVSAGVGRCRSPRWQYQASDRSPLPAPLSMNIVDGGKESERWKAEDTNGLCLWHKCWPQYAVAPAGGHRPMGSEPRATTPTLGIKEMSDFDLFPRCIQTIKRVRDKDKQKDVHPGKRTGVKITAVSLFMLYSKSTVFCNAGQLNSDGGWTTS